MLMEKKKILGFLYPVEASLAFQYLFYYYNFPCLLHIALLLFFSKGKSRSLCYFQYLNTDFQFYKHVSTSIYLHYTHTHKKYIGNNMRIEPPERKHLFD